MSLELLLKRPSPFAFPGGSPGFDPAHPLSSGISQGHGISVVAGPSGSVISLLSGLMNGTKSSVTGGTGPIGSYCGFPSSNSTMRFPGQSAQIDAAVTFAGIFTFDAGANFVTLPSLGGNSDVYGTLGSGCWVIFGNPGRIGLTISGGSNVFLTNFSSAWAVETPYMVIISADAAGSRALRINLSTGQAETTTGASFSLGVATTGVYMVGTNGFCGLEGKLATFMYAPVSTSLTKMKQCITEPWSFWYPQKFDFLQMLKAAIAGGTIFPQSIQATCTSTSTVKTTSAFLRTLTATCTSASNLVRSVGKILTATATSTSSFLKRIGKTVAATCTSTLTPSAIKVILKTLVATCTSSATLVIHSAFARSLVATCTSTSTLIRSVIKTLAATCTSTASVFGGRFYTRLLIATCTSTASVVAHKCVLFFQTVTATCTSSALISTIKSLAGAVASLASTLRPYKAPASPTMGNEVTFLLNELQKISSSFNAHVQVTKDLDKRLKSGGL